MFLTVQLRTEAQNVFGNRSSEVILQRSACRRAVNVHPCSVRAGHDPFKVFQLNADLVAGVAKMLSKEPVEKSAIRVAEKNSVASAELAQQTNGTHTILTHIR